MPSRRGEGGRWHGRPSGRGRDRARGHGRAATPPVAAAAANPDASQEIVLTPSLREVATLPPRRGQRMTDQIQ